MCATAGASYLHRLRRPCAFRSRSGRHQHRPTCAYRPDWRPPPRCTHSRRWRFDTSPCPLDLATAWLAFLPSPQSQPPPAQASRPALHQPAHLPLAVSRLAIHPPRAAEHRPSAGPQSLPGRPVSPLACRSPCILLSATWTTAQIPHRPRAAPPRPRRWPSRSPPTRAPRSRLAALPLQWGRAGVRVGVLP